MGYPQFKLIGAGAVVVGAVLVYWILRQPEWYVRVLPWIGAGLATILLLFGGALMYVGTTEKPLIRQEDQPTREELDSPAPSFAFPLVNAEGERQLEEYRGRVVLLTLLPW